MTEVDFGDELTTIEYQAFKNCAQLSKVEFGSGVKTIIHASISSDALKYAIDNGKEFSITDYNYYDDDTRMLDRKNKFMYTTQRDGVTELVVYFNLKNTVIIMKM